MAKGRKTGGRTTGTPNRLTGEVRALVREALTNAGGVAYLARQAKENPVAFMSLIGRLIPAEVSANVEQRMTLEQLVAESGRIRD